MACGHAIFTRQSSPCLIGNNTAVLNARPPPVGIVRCSAPVASGKGGQGGERRRWNSCSTIVVGFGHTNRRRTVANRCVAALAPGGQFRRHRLRKTSALATAPIFSLRGVAVGVP